MSPNPIYHLINGLYTEKQDSNKVAKNDLVENILDGQGKKYIGNKLKYIGNILKYIGKGKMLKVWRNSLSPILELTQTANLAKLLSNPLSVDRGDRDITSHSSKKNWKGVPVEKLMKQV